jgi:hypothetical protein
MEEKPKEGDHLVDVGVDGKDNIKMDIAESMMGGHGLNYGSEQGLMASPCQHSNEPLGSEKCWEFLN